MGIIVDTSVLIATERQDIDFSHWQEYEIAYISSITITELLTGVHRAANARIKIRRSAFVEHIINAIDFIPFGLEEARIYAQILDDLYKQSITIGVHDMQIAATAIANGHPVLTRNAKDFKRIQGVKVFTI